MRFQTQTRKRGKRVWNLPPLELPPELPANNSTSVTPLPHPHIFKVNKREETALNATFGPRVDFLKQHYRTPTSFVKIYRNDESARDEFQMTVASRQYDDMPTPIECRQEAETRLWGLSVPYLPPSEWITLGGYLKKYSGLENYKIVSSMTQAFWDSALKLVDSRLFHCDLWGNFHHNIMVRPTAGGHVAKLKIIDYGLCYRDPGSSDDVLCAFYGHVLDNILDGLLV